VGIDTNPAGKLSLIPSKEDHVLDNTDPHGSVLYQDALVSSGITALEQADFRSTITVEEDIVTGSGVTVDELDFSETVQFLDGSELSDQTHLHATGSGVQFIGIAPESDTVIERV